MKVFPEYFDFNQFEMARENMHSIKRPYINFYKTLGRELKFQEYSSNMKLQTLQSFRQGCCIVLRPPVSSESNALRKSLARNSGSSPRCAFSAQIGVSQAGGCTWPVFCERRK